MNTDSATGPSLGPKVWKDSPGCGNYEYEYEINAATGEIVKYDIEEE